MSTLETMTDFEAGVGSFAAHCEGYGMPSGFASVQAAYDAAEPDNTDEEADDTPECGGCSKAYRNACIHCSDYDG